MKAFWRRCCPCCIRGEPEEKPRVKVSYGEARSPKQAPEETVALLKPEEQHRDVINENGHTVKAKGGESSDQNKHDEEKEAEPPSETKQEDNEDNDKKDEDTGEAMKVNAERNTDTDNRKGTKTVTTATMEASSAGESRNSTREILEDAHNKSKRNEDEETEIVEYVDKYGRRIRRRIVKKIVTTTITTKKGSGEDGSESGKKDSDSDSSVYKKSVVTKKMDGDENRSELQRSTTSSDDKNQIVVVKTDRKIDMPDWMEESKSPGTKRQNLDSSDISIHLKYPTKDVTDKKEPGEKAKESKIQAELAKRDRPDISIDDDLKDLLKHKENEKPEVKRTEKEMKPAPPEPTPDDDEDDENEDDEDEDDEDEEGEYDEFEEEIVIIEVNRKYRFPKGMEAPKPVPEKVGIPIEDLLEIPIMQIQQESTPDDKHLMEEEDIESTERPPIVFSEPDWTLLNKL